MTAGAVSIDPLVKDQTIAEIEPLVPQVISMHFAEHNFDVVRNPKVRIHLDDARHYLLTTDEKFDAITSDPLDPWVKGAATLYTREFFQVVKDHLNPGGVVTLFVQLYESNEAAVKIEIATFLEAFPNGAVFANTVNGQGYDLVLFGQLEARKIDVDRVEQRLSDPANEAVRRSLSEIGINSAVELFGTYAGRSSLTWRVGCATASSTRTATSGFSTSQASASTSTSADTIYKAMIAESRYPDDLFAGSRRRHCSAARRASSPRWPRSRPQFVSARSSVWSPVDSLRSVAGQPTHECRLLPAYRQRGRDRGLKTAAPPVQTTVPGGMTPPFGTTMMPPRM